MDAENSDYDDENSKSRKKRRIQKYRAAWEYMPEFKYWLKPVPNDRLKARCCVCDKIMVSEIMVIRKHSACRKHVEKVIQGKQSRLKDLLRRSGATSESEEEGELERHGLVGNAENSSESEESVDENPVEAQGEHSSMDKSQVEAEDVKPNVKELENEQKSQIEVKDLVVNEPEDEVELDSDSSSESSLDECVPSLVQRAAPYWKTDAVMNGQIVELNLDDFKGKFLFLLFYPHDFSMICASDVLALSDRLELFHAINTEVVACSVDSVQAHLAWCRVRKEDGGAESVHIPLLSDNTHRIAKMYGCYMPEKGYAIRAHYIIDPEGIVRHMSFNDISVARGLDEIFRLIQAFQETDNKTYGCPADWRPGDNLYPLTPFP